MARSPSPLVHPSQTPRTTKEVLEMIDKALNAGPEPWEPNTPPATPDTPVPHS